MIPSRPTPPGFGSAPKPKLRRPAIVFQPRVYQGLKQGVDQLANVVRLTLGPLPRAVAIERMSRDRSPEILDDSATITRRVIQLPQRTVDVGAMLLRHSLWQMHEAVGDGSTTMAVIFQALLDEGIKYIVSAQGDPMLLRRGLERHMKTAIQALRACATPLQGRDKIAQMAMGLCQDDEMARLLGEIFDIVGGDGMVEIRGSSRRVTEREYIEGTYWDGSGWCSSLMETDHARHRTVLDDAAILITDISVENAGDLVPVLEMAVQAKLRNLVLVLRKIPDSGIALLLHNQKSGVINTLAVRTPKIIEADRMAALEDLAVLTGGRVFLGSESLAGVKPADLGHARQAWATADYFGVIGGKGDPHQLRQHIVRIRAMMNRSEGEDRERFQKRLGRLLGGTAILYVGGSTESETELRKAKAERAALTLRAALRGGVVPGGGAALLACQKALRLADDGHDAGGGPDDQAARRILCRALEEPLRVIAANAGYNPDTIVDRVKAAPDGYGFDAWTGQVVDMREAGIVDAALVLEKALQVAVSGASMALTTEVIVHRKRPQEAYTP